MTQTKADINFEKELWNAANELRGAVAENQYKDYVLPLIFLKHMSERYEMRRDELMDAFEDEASNYYGLSEDDRNYVLEDPDEYLSKNTYIIPKKATWEFLQDNAERDNIKVLVDEAFDTLDETLGAFRPELKGILPRIFVKSQLTSRQVGGLINLLSHPKLSVKENPESDILGRVYEYYIGKFAIAEGSGAGQFFTPGSIVRLMVEMIEPYKGKIFDAACGSGGMFVQSLKFLEAHGGDKRNISIYGQERYSGTLRLCKMNLALRDLSFDVRLGDSLLQDKFPDLEADYILVNPPFNVSQWHPEDLPDKDPRLFGPKEEFTTDGNANYMWMQTFWSHLSNTGTAAVVMANGAMTTGNKGEKNVRQHMVDEGMIDAIVRLPDKLFLTTGIPACIFILSKNRDGKDGVHRERKEEILFIDMSKMGRMESRRLRVFDEADLIKAVEAYHAWRNLPNKDNAPYENQDGFCYAATLEEVQKQDYKLTPGIYVGIEEEEDDGIPFEEKLAILKAQLKEQFREGEDLKRKILDNFDQF
ncbi:type I restriction-modification system subunit M [Robiginitalea biformata]|uniref:site-specific DNA-methyltransferase (adenine-specific) n=1 Tax=Robiginitalea biformata (strain ATCC BAA-864 / DSM 15991 / KCTC 12146 / HTCC2501) TaxID=313596 RepID=A4CI92_ROBBH|nr:class I SAM-dependent DNA methyltransferase [Robiginitalea biformata]EAR16650.1 type I restriction-modification system DNA methylase [Robiginitalea biformata HTCC2501]